MILPWIALSVIQEYTARVMKILHESVFMMSSVYSHYLISHEKRHSIIIIRPFTINC